MLFNRKDPRYFISEDQYITDEQYEGMKAEYKDRVGELMTTDVRTLMRNMKEYGAPGSTYDNEKKQSPIVGAIVIIWFLAVIVTAVAKKLVLFGELFAGGLLVIGLMLLITGKNGQFRSTNAAIHNRVTGLFLVFMSGGLLALLIGRSNFDKGELAVWCALVVSASVTLFLFIKAFLYRFATKFGYRGRAYATCRGYARTLRYDDDTGGRAMLRMYTSPIFEYSFEGERFEAVYDDFPPRRDSDIRVGEQTEIAIDEREPSCIVSPHVMKSGNVGLFLFIGLMFLLGTILIGYLLVSGKASDTNTKSSTRSEMTQAALEQITDEMIEQNYVEGQGITEWYVETGVVTDSETKSDGVHITLDDPDFAGVRYTPDNAPAVGNRRILFYFVDEDLLAAGLPYKCIIVSADADAFEYVGTHGSYVAAN